MLLSDISRVILEQKSIEDLFAEGEPTMKTLAELAKYCRKNNVKTVFAEELVSPAASKTLAEEAGAKVVAIYTMESNESGLSYLERRLQRVSRNDVQQVIPQNWTQSEDVHFYAYVMMRKIYLKDS